MVAHLSARRGCYKNKPNLNRKILSSKISMYKLVYSLSYYGICILEIYKELINNQVILKTEKNSTKLIYNLKKHVLTIFLICCQDNSEMLLDY